VRKVALVIIIFAITNSDLSGKTLRMNGEGLVVYSGESTKGDPTPRMSIWTEL
jgi:hypothetical protein